jgi:hypothetical protein
MKNLKIEAEKGFRRTLFEPELVDPNLEINFVNDAEAVVKKLQCQLLASKFNRKGNCLNYTMHVSKEPGVTHTTDLTIFYYKCRVFCSPSMGFRNSVLGNGSSEGED